jgi:hypothetical protein
MTEEKVCCACGVSKPHEDFYRLDAKCKPCRREFVKAYSAKRKKDPEYAEAKKAYWIEYNALHAERRRAYAKIRNALPEVKEHRKKYRAEYGAKNREALNARQRKYTKSPTQRLRDLELRRKYAEELTDSTVRRLLKKGTSLTTKDIPQSLVEVKRLQVLIKRSLQNEERR